jgi:hypothetical protein
MGVEASVELARPFAEVVKCKIGPLRSIYLYLLVDSVISGPKSRVDSVISHYMEGEYDFGIDCSVVMSITGYEIDDAKDLLQAHSKNDSGM